MWKGISINSLLRLGLNILQINGGCEVGEIILYSNGCYSCNVVKAKLKDKNKVFTEVNDMHIIMELAKEHKMTTLPIIKVGGVYYSGAEARDWIEGLE
jgi:hypothetical protein